MFEIPTVFVLGAGASAHFNFPTGPGLKSNLLNKLQGIQTLEFGRLTGAGHKQAKIAEFRKRLAESDVDSVDELLFHLREDTDLVNVGKAAIAQELIQNEQPELLVSSGIDNCYKPLKKALFQDPNWLDNAKIKFITFNYDRSLEQYLYMTWSACRQSCDTTSAAKICNKVLHVHGKLGPLDWEADEGRAYSADFKPESIHQASMGLLVTHEECSRGTAESAFDSLNEAQHIYFLGFGYHESNLRKLRFSELVRDHKTITGTSRGISIQRRGELQAKYGIQPTNAQTVTEFLVKDYGLE